MRQRFARLPAGASPPQKDHKHLLHRLANSVHRAKDSGGCDSHYQQHLGIFKVVGQHSHMNRFATNNVGIVAPQNSDKINSSILKRFFNLLKCMVFSDRKGVEWSASQKKYYHYNFSNSQGRILETLEPLSLCRSCSQKSKMVEIYSLSLVHLRRSYMKMIKFFCIQDMVMSKAQCLKYP